MNKTYFLLAFLGLTIALGFAWLLLSRDTTPPETAQNYEFASLESSSAWQPQIAIVWPHDGQGNGTSVTLARSVNVSVWPRNQVSCLDEPSDVGFYVTRNNAPAVRQGSGELILRTVNGVRFPSLEFNDIPVETASDGLVQHRFYVDIGGELSNVWVHAADARTIQPLTVEPDGETSGNPNKAWIQIVYPHDEQGVLAPVERATLVNIATDLFELNDLGQRLSAPSTHEADLKLFVAQDNQSLRESNISPIKSTYSLNNNGYPRWDFNDIPVQPGQQFHFMIGNTGSGGTSSIWTHAEDARTIIPQAAVPPPCLEPTATPIPAPATATPDAYPYPEPEPEPEPYP